MKLPLAVAILLLATAARAATPAAPTANTSPSGLDPLLEELLSRDRKINFAVPESDAPDAPIRGFYGNLASEGTAPAVTARTFVEKYGKLLGFPPGFDWEKGLAPMRTASGPRGQTLSFAPQRKGVPFPSGAITFSFAPGGTLTAVDGRWRDLKDAQPGSISPAEAVRRAFGEAERRLPGRALTGDGEVRQYFAEVKGAIAHQYRVDLPFGEPGRDYRCTLVAGGEVLSFKEVMHAAADAKVNLGYPKPKEDVKPLESIFSVKEILKPIADVDVNYRVWGFKFWSDTSYVDPASHPDGQFRYDMFAGLKSAPEMAHPQYLEPHVYYHLMRVREKAIAWGVPEVDDHMVTFDVWRPGFKESAGEKEGETEEKSNNAWYKFGRYRIEFAAKNDDHDYRSPALDLSIIYHEYGHYVHECLNPSYDAGGSDDEEAEANAISEGLGDTIGAAILNHPEKSAYWNGGKGYRNAVNTLSVDKVTPCTWDFIDGQEDREIHKAGQVFSGMFWDLKTELGDPATDDIMKIICSGLRKAQAPHTFRRVAWGMLAADIEQFDGKHLGPLIRVMSRRKMLPKFIRRLAGMD